MEYLTKRLINKSPIRWYSQYAEQKVKIMVISIIKNSLCLECTGFYLEALGRSDLKTQRASYPQSQFKPI